MDPRQGPLRKKAWPGHTSCSQGFCEEQEEHSSLSEFETMSVLTSWRVHVLLLCHYLGSTFPF